jgi:hypothetical protein
MGACSTGICARHYTQRSVEEVVDGQVDDCGLFGGAGLDAPPSFYVVDGRDECVPGKAVELFPWAGVQFEGKDGANRVRWSVSVESLWRGWRTS